MNNKFEGVCCSFNAVFFCPIEFFKIYIYKKCHQTHNQTAYREFHTGVSSLLLV